MRQKNIGLSILILIIIAGGIWFAYQKTRPIPSQPLEKVTIAEFGEIFIYAPLYVAEAKGFYREEGLDVTIFPAGGLDKTYAALSSGQAQFGVADPLFVAIAGEKGQPGRVIAAVVQGVPLSGVARDPRIPMISQPADLDNFRVSTTPAPSTAYTLQTTMFRQAELEPNIRELALGTGLAALEKGAVDIALEFEPNVSLGVEKGGRIVYHMSDYYPTFAFTGMMVLPEYLNQHPDTAQKVVNALQRGFRFIREQPDEVVDILTKRFPNVEQTVARAAVIRLIENNNWPEHAIVNRDGWEVATDVRRAIGHITQVAPYETYVITTFAERAKEALR